MKNLLFSLVVSLIAFTGYSQAGKDYITMKSDGKVYWMRSGKTIQMMIDVPLKNGSVVNYKGTITSKDGESTQLKPGDKVMMDGTMINKK